MKKPTPFGKYFLLERINVGGMAEVFRAKAFGVEGFERLVAVKRILPNIAEDKEFIRMFIEEAKLSVQLNHANIAQIFDLGVVDGSYYIALEHVHGRDLRGIFDRCRNLGEPMPVAQACFVAMKVCEGLDYAHNKRDQAGRELSLVHRDVSPQNILVSFEGEVKIIDFGIAKAAGKGSKTQAGILKGKFGYMSPEQVRGLPVDRRSDVFSCGIVLYELLTGERLFVGESDFSTLEKVRNVEILPPSTYNRRIPDELERIVLKALSKDPEDRYQNAIDLHDELQAFVYTAGEFYSRKDLAGWMKKTFGKEIEEETAKLESYRQLKPPTDAPIPVVARAATGSRPIVSGGPPTAPPPPRKSMTMNAVGGTRPPPPPPRTTGQHAAVAPSQSMKLPAVPPGATPPSPRSEDSGDLAWDDDELETQIYDNPEDDPKRSSAGRASAKLPLAAPSQSQPGLVPTAPPNAPTASAPLPGGPDLSSLSSSSRGWNAAEPLPPPGATLNGLGIDTYSSTAPKLATGSNKVPSPYEPEAVDRMPGALPAAGPIVNPMAAPAYPFDPPLRDSQPAYFDPMASFGQGVVGQGRKKGVSGVVMIAAGGVALAAVAVVAVVLLSNNTGSSSSKKDDTVATTGTQGVAAPTQAAPVGDQNTGFDLYVSPGGVTQWRLDGDLRTDRLPSRIRGIAPGAHTVAIDAPPGFVGGSQVVQVEAGKAPKVEIALAPIENLSGLFDSTPPGAEVSLIVDGKRQSLGASPAHAKLDPRMTYQVLFEKQGYVSVNRPIVFTGAPEEKIIVNLEKASSVAVDTPPEKKQPPVQTPIRRPPVDKPPVERTAVVDKPPVDKPPIDKPPVDKPPVDKPPVDKPPAAAGTGSLTLGSKPPCDIFIDGKATGQHTPQRDIKLSVGRHRITLMNNEFGIKETFNVDVKADTPEKMIKDYSDRLPK